MESEEKKQPKSKISRVIERNRGTLLWEYKGKYLGDGQGNVLAVQSYSPGTDPVNYLQQSSKISKIALQIAKDEQDDEIAAGKVVFRDDVDMVTDSEVEMQRERLEQGFIPNPNDPGNWKRV